MVTGQSLRPDGHLPLHKGGSEKKKPLTAGDTATKGRGNRTRVLYTRRGEKVNG